MGLIMLMVGTIWTILYIILFIMDIVKMVRYENIVYLSHFRITVVCISSLF
jgi:hypothetical protein